MQTIKNKILPLLTLLMLLMLGGWNSLVWGNSVSSKNSSSDVKDGKIVMYGNHASFTFGATDGHSISYTGGVTSAYKLGQLDHNSSRNFTFTWSGNSGCTVKVTKISFDIRAYSASEEMMASFYGDGPRRINNVVAGNESFSASNANGLTNGITLTISNTCTGHKTVYIPFVGWQYSYDNNVDFYIENISITYTITPDAPTAVATTHTIYATLNTGSIANNEKLQLNTASCFSMPGNDGHFYDHLSYYRSQPDGSSVNASTDANISNNYFYATKVGTYLVKAKISKSNNCHEASDYSGNITINVIGHPSSITMNNGEVFVKVKEGVAASQLDLNTLIQSQTGDGSVSYEVTSANKSTATISGPIFSATACGTYTIAATKAASDKYAESSPSSFSVVVKKITPTVTTLPTASAISYQQTISNSNLTGGAATWNGYTVDGSYSWEDGTLAPEAGNSCKAIFTPSDLTRFEPTTCMVNVPINPIDQTITWNLEEKDDKDQYREYATGETFDATATSELTVTYTSSDESIAIIENGNQLRVLRANEEVTIYANQSGNANWNAAPTVSKTFKTCGAKPNDWSEVTADTITYGQLLEESQLEGDVKLNGSPIRGTLEWVEPATLPNATKTTPEAFAVLFTPNDKELYASVTFDIPVTVAKADPVITWNLPNNLRENTNYNQFVTSSNKETPLSVTEYSPYLSVSDVNLSVTEIGDTRIQNVTIHLEQAGSDNFNAISDDKTVDIYPKVKQCVPVEINDVKDTVLIQNMAGSYEGTHTWCTSAAEGSGFLVVPVKYTQYYGLQLGEWNEGLKDKNIRELIKNLGDLELDGTDKWIELNFTGVPDSLIFDTKLQQVFFNILYWFSDESWTEAKQKNPTWEVYQKSLDGSERRINSYNALTTTSIKVALDSTTTAVKIKLKSPFAGFIQNLKITQRKYIRAYTNRLTFGTNEKPLQEPQKLKVYYSSVGSCEYSTDTILVTTDGDAAFYIDRDTITTNVGIDQWGKDSIYVRCNDVNKSGRVIFRSIHSNAELVVPVGSAKPEISASTTVFQTGTEHTPEAEKPYRTLRTHDFSACFNAGTPRFDSLYIYGVSASASTSRQWAYDDAKRYNVPVVTASNVHTPCFVYVKDNNKYVYKRTFDAATKTLNISAANKKLAFMGYKPVKNGSAAPAIQLNGNADVYFNDAEINANGVALKVNNATTTVYSRGDNKLIANSGAAVQLTGDASLTIEHSWNGGESRLALNPSFGNPSIDLSSNSNVTIQGTQLQLHNAPMYIFGQSVNMAIANMSGDKTTGSVAIKDGTITGDATLGMPRNTIIDGGTFNDGTVKVYDAMGREFPPMNTDGDLLARLTMAYDELPATGYGKNHLVVDAGKVHPMLEDPNICKFTGQQNNLSDNNSNWVNSWNNNDVIVKHDMDVVSDITAKSLTINPNVTVTVKNGATLSVNSYSLKETVGNLRVENGGKVILNEGDLNVKDFILDAQLSGRDVNKVKTDGNSGQVKNPSKIVTNGKAYFDLTFDPSGKISFGWYDFTVPFSVNIQGGIARVNSAHNKVMESRKDFIIMEFDEADYANGGKGWRRKYNGVLQPGILYSVTFDDEVNQNTFRFTWNGEGSLANGNEYSAQYTHGDSVSMRGWNGLGNGMLRQGYISGAYIKAQVFNHTENKYEVLSGNFAFAVGTAFFIQVDQVETVNWNVYSEDAKDGRVMYAPKRAAQEVEEFHLSIREENSDESADELYVSANEDATDEYVIGRDLMKMGTPTEAKSAQMWVRKRSANLCDIEMPLVYGEANCDLNVFAPADGTYLLEIENGPADAELYLTYNGKVIWDLSSSPASLVLKKGLKEGFGLRMKYNDAPGMAEGVDDINDETQSMRKVLIDNKIYIITPEGAMYDVNGKLIR